MVTAKKIEIVGFVQKDPYRLSLDLRLGKERGIFEVSVFDRDGIFGLEFPDSLGLKLRDFSPGESRKLIKSIKRLFTGKLRAA